MLNGRLRPKEQVHDSLCLMHFDGIFRNLKYHVSIPPTSCHHVHRHRHGFFDKNLLALKLDGKEEFAIFLNENGEEYQQLKSFQGINTTLNKHTIQSYLRKRKRKGKTQRQISKSDGGYYFHLYLRFFTLNS